MRLITAAEVPASPARVHAPTRPRAGRPRPARVGRRPRGLVETLRDGIRTAAEAGARIVFLPELTLSRYPADTLPEGTPSTTAEDLDDGPTVTFAREAAPRHRRLRARLALRAAPTEGRRRAGLQHRRRSSPRAVRSWRAPARPTSRSPPATTRTSTSGPGPPDDAYPVVALGDPVAAGSGCRPAGTSGSPRSPALYSLGGAEVLVLPDRHRLRARPPRLRHPAAVAAGHRRQRHRQRAVHGGAQPLRHRGPHHLLRQSRSSPTRTAASSCRPRATRRRCSSPTSTSRSAATGSSCSRSSRPAAPTRMPP